VIVADACVTAKLFLNEPLSDVADKLVRRNSPVFMPEIALVEVSSAITRAYRNKIITKAEAEEKLEQWRRFAALDTVRLTPNADLLPDAEEFSLTFRYPVADCLYLAAAKKYDLRLITTDQPFIDAVKARFSNIHHLSSQAA